MKRTLQRNKVRRLKKHGFMNRQKTNAGRKVLQKRRLKKRNRLTVSDEH